LPGCAAVPRTCNRKRIVDQLPDNDLSIFAAITNALQRALADGGGFSDGEAVRYQGCPHR
jgi:hypothetical protein